MLLRFKWVDLIVSILSRTTELCAILFSFDDNSDNAFVHVASAAVCLYHSAQSAMVTYQDRCSGALCNTCRDYKFPSYCNANYALEDDDVACSVLNGL